jgi:hypothetical protein
MKLHDTTKHRSDIHEQVISFITNVGLRSWSIRVRHCATSRKVAGSIPVRPHYGPQVQSAFNGNEYQGYPLGVKVADA